MQLSKRIHMRMYVHACGVCTWRGTSYVRIRTYILCMHARAHTYAFDRSSNRSTRVDRQMSTYVRVNAHEFERICACPRTLRTCTNFYKAIDRSIPHAWAHAWTSIDRSLNVPMTSSAGSIDRSRSTTMTAYGTSVAYRLARTSIAQIGRSLMEIDGPIR